MTVTLNDVLRFFHAQNLSNASDEEAMFFFHLHFQLLANAKILAREAHGNCDRALQTLLAAVANEAE
jgi:hypothetical protein